MNRLTMCGYLAMALPGMLFNTSLGAQERSAPAGRVELQQLSWLVGQWSYRDTATAADGTYRDAGVRECAWALRNAYIRCESSGSVGDRTRQYVFYFNFNELEGRLEMLAMHSDYGRKTLYTVRVSAAGRRLDLLGPIVPQRDGTTTQSWGTVLYDGTGEMRWETRIHRSDQHPDAWPVRFAELATRRPPR